MDSATRAWWIVAIVMVCAFIALLLHAVAVAGIALVVALLAGLTAERMLFRRDRR